MNSITIVSDLRAKFGEARDQGSRPTCLAFAASDAHSFGIGLPWRPLSCEYLFFHAKKGDGSSPRRGTNISAIKVALINEGQPHEGEWPYLPKLPLDLSTWVPPTVGGSLNRADLIRFSEPSMDGIWQTLESGEPMIIGMTLSDAFYTVDADGIVDSDEPVQSASKHALVVVAVGTKRKDRMFLVRNSWGKAWGISGYGWLSERYLKPRVIVAAQLKAKRANSNYV
ncbi:MAG: C1 family peptidase [Pirellula sp.]